ncbi:class I SAM-dependent methyltransferase [Salipaludibacillus sp. HK11]|uniref:class I SAM-dependent methyltransferase n=1 Tax=Salipaludibacillus sp. HK11 TaxID=3394320 RepID=UPI0039FC8E93
MEDDVKLSNWNDPTVIDYDKIIRRKIAGYSLLYDMTSRLMKAALYHKLSGQELLIVGAGGGEELVTLGSFEKNWHFTALDSSEPMIEIARRRIAKLNLSERVSFKKTALEDYITPAVYDGVTCLLVLHFIKGIDKKRQFINLIASKMRTGSPLFLAAINGDKKSYGFSIQMDAWKSYMISQGIRTEEFSKFNASFGEQTDPIPSEDLVSLLHESGFSDVNRYFGSYLIEGYMAFKK